MEMEQKKKVARLNEKEIPVENELQIDDEVSDMDKLPTEILTKIFDYLNEQQLVKCRLLSPQWNEICCLLLQEKTKMNSYSRLVVHLQKNPEDSSMEIKTVITGPLDDFVQCFSSEENSTDIRRLQPFPFSRFNIQDFSYLNESQIICFYSTFGQNMKFLTLDTKERDGKNFQKVWKLLLKFAPNIQHLEIGGGHWLNKLNLFESGSGSNENEDKQEETESFLQNLRTLEVTRNKSFSKFDRFLKDLLINAPNLEKLSTSIPPAHHFCIVEEFKIAELLQSCGKPHLLKKLEIKPSFHSHLSPSQLMKNVQLEYLKADCVGATNSVENEKKTTTNYIYHALKSSQDTLSTLNITMDSINFCFKDISSLPHVRRLQIRDLSLSTTFRNILLERISQLCPNTKSLHLDGLVVEFSKMAPTLWTEFTGLKSLKFELLVTNNIIHDKNSARSLDSAFSGYSQESIQKIQTKLDQGVSLEDARQGEEQNPSIVDLKGLSRLELQFFMSDRKDQMEGAEDRLRNSIFAKILPQHIQENPRSFMYRYYN